MAKRVILAVAGAGKTYHICHEIDPQKRNLILAFTHENIHNIQKELYDAYKCMPELTTVATFDSFVYHELMLSSSTPYSLLSFMLSGSIPKKLPTPQDGSRMLPR